MSNHAPPHPAASTLPNSAVSCFWYANGNLVCSSAGASTSPPSHSAPTPAPLAGSNVEFASFGTPNQNYAPNAYKKHLAWYNRQHEPCCNVPCNTPCTPPTPSALSPPRDFQKTNAFGA